ncbi:SbcC/MukB-like Walker B domain-containing protein, partial [Microbacterium ulmi]
PRADAAEESSRLAAAAAAAEADRDARLVRSPFADAAEASAALLASAAQDALADGIHAHDVALSRERERLLLLETDLAGVPDEPVDLAEASAAAAAARAAWNDAVATAARDREVATQLADAAARAADVHAASAEGLRDYEVIAGLANAVAGRTDSRMDLETFVLAAELEEIVAMANLRLDAMSDGRYRLQHTDAVGARRVASGLGLVVLDAYTGQTRQPQSLSGGETFLASLALALGLAQVVTQRAGGVRLDTLFIDEGFGSLDAETLDLAMRTLDELRQGGRTVGLISHVEAMKEQLPARLHVEATPQGPSVIRQDAGARV